MEDEFRFRESLLKGDLKVARFWAVVATVAALVLTFLLTQANEEKTTLQRENSDLLRLENTLDGYQNDVQVLAGKADVTESTCRRFRMLFTLDQFAECLDVALEVAKDANRENGESFTPPEPDS